MLLVCDLEFTQVARELSTTCPVLSFCHTGPHGTRGTKATHRYDSSYCTPPVMRQRDLIHRSDRAVDPTARPADIALRRLRRVIRDRKCISEVEMCSVLETCASFSYQCVISPSVRNFVALSSAEIPSVSATDALFPRCVILPSSPEPQSRGSK